MNIYDYIEKEDLNEYLQEIASENGIETVRKLIENSPRSTIHIPKVTSLKDVVRRFITDNPELTKMDLCKQLNVTKRWLREL